MLQETQSRDLHMRNWWQGQKTSWH